MTNNKYELNENLEQASGGSSSVLIKVPNVIGKYYDDAKDELSNVGLSISTEYEESTHPKGYILRTEPLPGISVSRNSKVILYVSSGNN